MRIPALLAAALAVAAPAVVPAFAVPGPAGPFAEPNAAFLRQLVQAAHPGAALDEATLAAVRAAAERAAAVDLRASAAGAEHLAPTPVGTLDWGEIWTFNPGPSTSPASLGAFCVAIPMSWSYYHWVAGHPVVEVPAGMHYMWTSSHSTFGSLTPIHGAHAPGRLVGDWCLFNAPLFSATFGEGVFLYGP